MIEYISGVTCWYGVTAGLVSGTVSDELRSAVGQRLAGVENTSRSLFGDGEDSPLRESQRSSTLAFIFRCICSGLFTCDWIIVLRSLSAAELEKVLYFIYLVMGGRF